MLLGLLGLAIILIGLIIIICLIKYSKKSPVRVKTMKMQQVAKIQNVSAIVSPDRSAIISPVKFEAGLE